MRFDLCMQELIIILFSIMIIFGPGKLPQIRSGAAKGILNLKK
ncbi:MAG: twin-arginine translocase TatA/TatE family subunit [Desulfobacteraceae bacterium]|nr:MAG: twin-arginine translocase TatA/TatE family subunit [Desulfobacteraceae bacterium]